MTDGYICTDALSRSSQSVLLPVEKAGVVPDLGLELAPPLLEGLERDDLDARLADLPAEAREEVEGVPDDALGQLDLDLLLRRGPGRCARRGD